MSLFEINKMREILTHVHDKTLVVCDLDNTLIEACSHFGSVQWNQHFRESALRQGIDPQEVEKIANHLWHFAQIHVQVRLVDPSALEIIAELKKNNIPLLGLTARDPLVQEQTHKQLQSVGLTFSYDLIFAGEIPKSKALVDFLQKNELAVERIVFVDDLWENIWDVEAGLKERNIDFRGLRFAGADERVRAFDPLIAEKQLKSLPLLLSDEEAEK